MESLPSNLIWKFTPETLVDIRKMYNLDGPGRMDDAIDLLGDWIKKQSHFIKKDFSRDYLERCIIFCKGSVEKAKKNMDSLCTLRSMIPQMYGDYDFRSDKRFETVFTLQHSAMLPRLTPDHHRVFLLRISDQPITKQAFSDYYRFTLAFCDYWRLHDYSTGFILVLDYRDLIISEYIASLDLIETRLTVTMYIEGFKARVKGIHIITSSSMIHMVVKLLKQAVTAKIRDRFHVHQTTEELYEIVPRDIMPVEYGGQEKSLKELQDELIDAVSTKEHRDFMKEMNNAVTKENNRLKEKYTEDMGLSGTFRTLNVD